MRSLARHVNNNQIVIIGAGAMGLSAGFYLSKNGYKVTVIEADNEVGGIAGGFEFGDRVIDKFYHHTFTHHVNFLDLVRKVGCEKNVNFFSSRTASFCEDRFYKLSTPLDWLRFGSLSVSDKLRHAFFIATVVATSDWKRKESLSVKDWFKKTGQDNVYRILWEPLLRQKFGDLHGGVPAAWLFGKFASRGGSRDCLGRERLAYYRGGYQMLWEHIAKAIEHAGGQILKNSRVSKIGVGQSARHCVTTENKEIEADMVISTIALPALADLLQDNASVSSYTSLLRTVSYAANICLVLDLKNKLSDTYWLTIHDPKFPFNCIVDNSNIDSSHRTGTGNEVYLSKYLAVSDPLFKTEKEAVLANFIPFLQKLFPSFTREWIKNSFVSKAKYAQFVPELNFSLLLDKIRKLPLKNFLFSDMAMLYPCDRGIDSSIGEGRILAEKAARLLNDKAR